MAKSKSKKRNGRIKGITFGTNAKGYYLAIYQFNTLVNGQPKRARTVRRIPDGASESQKWSTAEQLVRDTQAQLANSTTTTLEDKPARRISGHTLTWDQLIEWYKDHYCVDAEMNGDRQVKSGSLSAKRDRPRLDQIRAAIGAGKLVRDTTTEDLWKYKNKRMATPIERWKYKRDPQTNAVVTDRQGEPIKITWTKDREFTGVHRELGLIRQLLKKAATKKWIELNPWDPKLIDTTQENKRDQIVTQAHETILLDQCQDHATRRHLWLYLTVAFDSGCRSGELRGLLVKDCNFETNEFVVFSYKGGKRTDRPIPMTPRARVALLDACTDKGPEDHVFTYAKKIKQADGTTKTEHRPLKYAPKTSFNTAKRLAKWWSDDQVNLDNFRGHDIRHTTITRLVNSNQVANANIMKHTGHSQMKTFLRYVNPDHTERAHIANVLATYEDRNVVNIKAPRKTKKTKAA